MVPDGLYRGARVHQYDSAAIPRTVPSAARSTRRARRVDTFTERTHRSRSARRSPRVAAEGVAVPSLLIEGEHLDRLRAL
jgi:hypothetical protein